MKIDVLVAEGHTRQTATEHLQAQPPAALHPYLEGKTASTAG